MFVTLEENEDPKTEQEELVSVDGVAVSCFKGLGGSVCKTSTKYNTCIVTGDGSGPQWGGDDHQVVTKKRNGEQRTRLTNMTYAKYEAPEAEFRALEDSGFNSLPQCWTSSDFDNVKVWDCEAKKTTCVRNDVTRAKMTPKH